MIISGIIFYHLEPNHSVMVTILFLTVGFFYSIILLANYFHLRGTLQISIIYLQQRFGQKRHMICQRT